MQLTRWAVAAAVSISLTAWSSGVSGTGDSAPGSTPADSDYVAVDNPQRQAARVDYYNRKLGATLPNATTDSTIASLDAFHENVVQPPDFHYSTWFAFGRQHLLQFSCQVGSTCSAAPVIANACQAMRDSIGVS